MNHAQRIFVIGHRNPDTDSICSAMAYAELCRQQGREDIQAARAGGVNRQTAYVLDRLGQSPPVLLTDVYPRVRDTLRDTPAMIGADAPLAQALELMRERDIRMLPVVESSGQPLGALILKRLTEHLLLPRDGRPIRRALTSPKSLQTCLQASPIHLTDAERTEELDLFVGAMALPSFRKRLDGTDPRSTVIFVGDRRDIQMDAIDRGIRLLVVTGNLPIEQDLVARARDKGVSILCTAFDTATSALLARISTPVRYLVDPDIPRTGPDERLDEVRKVFMRMTAPGLLVVDDQEQVCGVVTKSNLLQPSLLKLILVDHNELTQAVPGADQVTISEVIDHHRLGNFHTEEPIRFINAPLGSTCSVVATLFRQAGVRPAPEVASLMLAGLLSDTVLLKSPTTTDQDRALVPWLEECSGLDAKVFGEDMFQAGSALAAYADTEALLTADFKEYEIDERRIGIGQVEVVTFQEFEDRRDEITSGLAALVEDRGLALAGLLVTDIVAQNSQLVVEGDKDLVAAVGYPQIAAGRFELKNVLSRKKQLMPHLLRAFRAEGVGKKMAP
ncbi:MAG: putative manganese-dependent inorganic diphosphatase [Desulfuromonadales bacterium]|jgi:manganese-dependent inorganic pyrophosphatase